MPTTLKQGDSGKLVSDLQTLLNAKLAAKLAVDGKYGDATHKAVLDFQKSAGLKASGTVELDTAAALGKVAGPPGIAFARALGVPEEKPAEELVTITLNGKKGTMTKAEFVDFQAKAKDAIRGTLRAAQQQAVQARTLWNHFQELNTAGGVDGVVAWCVSLTGPELPDGGLIVDAEAAVKRLESALGGTDFDKIASALQAVTEPVNKAAKAMWQYQKGVIGSAENWVTGLEVTRDVSFEVAKAIAKYEAGGNPTAVRIIDTASEAVKSAAGEAGKAIAGTSKGLGPAMKQVATDAVIAGITSLLLGEGSKGEAVKKKITELTTARLAKTQIQWLAKRPAVQKFIAGWVASYLAANAAKIAKETMKFATSDMKFDQLAENVAKSLVTSFPLAGLDAWVDGKLTKSTWEKMKKYPAFMAELKAQKIFDVQEKIAIEILGKELLSGGSSTLVEKSLDAVVAKASGTATVDQIGNAAVDDLVKSAGFAALCTKVAKQMKK